MKLSHTATFTVLASLALVISALLLNPIPNDPDVLFPAASRLGCFFMFLFWALGVVCWGRVVSFLLKEPEEGWLEWMAYGTLTASALALLLGSLGLIGYGLQPLYLALTLLGPLVDVGLRRNRTQAKVSRQNFLKWFLGSERLSATACLSGLFLLGILLEIISRLNGASIPHYHSDPMFYHLLGPRLWSSAGKTFFTWLIPFAMQCSYWEALGLWGNSLLGGAHHKGLIEGILFMQWAHVVFGYAATAVALDRVFALRKAELGWRRLGVFAALTSGVVGWTAWQAKNDWGLAFWCLAGFCFLLKGHAKNRRAFFIGGMFFGLAVVNKVVLGLVVMPLLLLWGVETSFFGTSFVIAGMATTSAPILIRNWIALGNPIYPAMNGLFKSPWVNETISQIVLAPQSRPTLALTLQRFRLLFEQDTLFLFIFVLVPAGMFVKKLKLTPFEFIPLVALTTVLAFVGPPYGIDDMTLHLRFLGFALPLGQALAIVLVGRGVGALKSRTWLAPVMMLSLFVFVTTRFEHPLVFEVANPAETFRTAVVGGESKAWLRMNVPAEALIVTTGDNQLYPIADLNVTSMPHVPYLDWVSRNITDPYRFISTLKELGVSYVLDSKTPVLTSWSTASKTLAKAVVAHPESIVFDAKQSMVVDLNRLHEVMMPSCVLPISQ